MSQYENYRNEIIIENNFKIKKLEKENNTLSYFIYFQTIIFSVCFLVISFYIDKQDNRLNEHKRLLIAQQEQINQLIINAEYNKLRNEKKVK